jgi:mannose-6-phosphate isomerase-like protein (cupin superfamily)
MGNMIYGFEAVEDRRVIESSPMLYISPEAHPTRLLDYHDVFYVVDGNWGVILEKEEIVLKSGDLALLPAGFHHYGRRLCSPKTRTIYIHFMAKKGDRIPKRKKHTALLIPSYSHPESGKVLEYFEDIMRTWRSGLSHRDLRCSVLLIHPAKIY